MKGDYEGNAPLKRKERKDSRIPEFEITSTLRSRLANMKEKSPIRRGADEGEGRRGDKGGEAHKA